MGPLGRLRGAMVSLLRASSAGTEGEEKRASLDGGVEKNVNVISNVGQDEVVCFFFLISYFMQGWAEDVAGMAYALRSLPEGAPCLPQVRASSGVPVPVGDWGAGVGLVGGGAGKDWFPPNPNPFS